MSSSKVAVVIDSIIEKVLLVVGILFLLFFGLMAIFEFTSFRTVEPFFIVFCLACSSFGAYLIHQSRKKRRFILLFRKYVSVLSGDPSGSISNLASAMGVTDASIIHDVETMIRKRYFSNAHIDLGSNRIILSRDCVPSPESPSSKIGAPATSGPGQELPEMISVSCPGCGGVNPTPKGHAVECEYCGSIIHG